MSLSLRFEVVVEGTAGALTVERTGADRVELVSALVEGGVTPSLGTVEEVLEHTSHVGVHPIVRPRGGDFVYDAHEVAAMERDVRRFARAGVPGVVIGALTPQGTVDRPVVRRLVAAAAGASVTFHRAFDRAADPHASLEDLVDLGVDRVLTSGQQATAAEGSELIAELVERAGGRITVMPGGGVRADNAATLVATTGVTELHFSAMETVASPATVGNPRLNGEGRVPPESERRVTSAERVVRVMKAARDAP